MAPQLRMTQVEKVIDLTPHMRRIVLGGKELNDFPEHQESAHVKVIVPEDGDERPSLGMFSKYKRSMRSYTIRDFDSNAKKMTIDFAVNDHQGHVTNWASKAKPGDLLAIAGPGSIKHTDFSAQWHLFIGDLTALPAIAATVEQLPDDAVGKAFIQVPLEEDKQAFKTPKNIEVEWIINPYNGQNLLIESLKKMPWPTLKPAIFLAAEAAQVKDIKSYLYEHENFDKRLLYSSAYWNVKK